MPDTTPQTVPLYGPGGIYNAQPEEVSDLINSGFNHATPEQIQNEKPFESLKAGAEGVASGLLSAPVSTGLELASGIAKPEDISRRSKTTAHGVGQTIGLIAPAAIPFGMGIAARAGLAAPELASGAASLAELTQTGLLSKVAEPLAEAVGLGGEGAGLISRAAGTSLKSMSDMALLSTGDEIAKSMVHDPDLTVGSALTDIGLSSALGGVFGLGGHLVAGSLWKATKSSGLGSLLDALKTKANMTAATGASEQLGFDIPESIKGAISGEGKASELAGQLRESQTPAGLSYKSDLDNFRKQAADGVFNVLGRDASFTGEGLSNFDSGSQVQAKLTDEIRNITKPASQLFEPIADKFNSVPLSDSVKHDIGEALGKMAIENDYTLSPSSSMMSEINRVLKEVPGLNTLENLRGYQSVARANAGDLDGFRLGKNIVKVLRDAEENVLTTAVKEQAPELLEQLHVARSTWRGVREMLDDLNDRLHVGRFEGPEQFIKNLGDMSPEDVLKRLKGTKDAGLLNMLSEKFPQTAELVKESHIDQLLNKRLQDGSFNTTQFFKALADPNKISPELRTFLFNEEQWNRLSNIQNAIQKLPEIKNPPHTASMMDKLQSKVLGGAGAVISTLLGHGPVSGWLLGQGARYLTREAPDALKLAYLKFLGTDAATNPAAFNTMVNFINAAKNGAKNLEHASAGIFKPGVDVLKDKIKPGKEDLNKLDKTVQKVSQNPLSDKEFELAHYLPEHGTAMSKAAASAVQYLSSQRPVPSKLSALDEEIPISKSQKYNYERTLRIAEQPLSVIEHLKNGTLNSNDVKDLGTMYPEYYAAMKQKVYGSMIEHVEKDGKIPYTLRKSLSLFLGEPVDPTLNPQSIQAAQMVYAPQSTTQPAGSLKHGTKPLAKLAQNYQTPNEARQSDKRA